MATKKKAASASAEAKATQSDVLTEVVRLTKQNQVAYTSEAEHSQLLADGLVEINSSMVQGDKYATRATAKGIAMVDGPNSEWGAQTVAASDVGSVSAEDLAGSKPSFKIEKGIEIPAIVGRGKVATAYPFDDMQVGDSFFVDKPAKNLASTVSSANARYATEEKDAQGNTIMRANRKGEQVPKLNYGRKYIVRSVPGGSRIWRQA